MYRSLQYGYDTVLYKIMAKTKKLHLGIGASCSCFTKFLHPAKDVRAHYTNADSRHQVTELLVQRRDRKVVNKKEQWCVIFT